MLYNPGDTNFTSQVSEVLAGQPDAIGILAFAETAQIVPELVTQGFPASGMYFVDGNLSNSYNFPEGTLATDVEDKARTSSQPTVDPAA